jgi:hypothetical protein
MLSTESLDSTPIWTAFITHQITSPRWMRRAKDSPTIYLADLKRHIFSSEYRPHIAASGEHILDFDVLEGVSQYSLVTARRADTPRRYGVRKNDQAIRQKVWPLPIVVASDDLFSSQFPISDCMCDEDHDY